MRKTCKKDIAQRHRMTVPWYFSIKNLLPWAALPQTQAKLPLQIILKLARTLCDEALSIALFSLSLKKICNITGKYWQNNSITSDREAGEKYCFYCTTKNVRKCSSGSSDNATFWTSAICWLSYSGSVFCHVHGRLPMSSQRATSSTSCLKLRTFHLDVGVDLERSKNRD